MHSNFEEADFSRISPQDQGNRKRQHFSPPAEECSTKRFRCYESSDEEVGLEIDLDSPLPSGVADKQSLVSLASLTNNLLVTTTTGSRCVFKIKDTDVNTVLDNIRHCPATATEGYYRLLDEVEAKVAVKNIRKKQSTLVNQIDKQNDSNFECDSLWVDKYTPRTYLELLSPESVNRQLLTWLKCWNKFVFHKELPKLPTAVDGTVDEAFQIDEKDERPMKKVAILSGPPGIGKTTLAHILAKHCGYWTKEMNASDDRTADSLHHELANADTDWILPSCLVIDEIDGMSSAAISLLVNAINSPLQRKEATGGSNKKRTSISIRRPIICICNDLYCAALRPLRQLCYVLKVPPPDYGLLMHRLSDICSMEGIVCERAVLSSLVDRTNRDTRACLNSLQFLNQKALDKISYADVEALNIGNKDMEINIFSVWRDVFCDSMVPVRKPYGANTTIGSASDTKTRRILRQSSASGDIDLVINGIYENYLNIVKFKDLMLREMVAAADWFVFADTVNANVWTLQNYEVAAYRQFLIAFIHVSFASVAALNAVQIQWPSAEATAIANHKRTLAVYEAFQGGLIFGTAASRWAQARHSAILDVLPGLVEVIKPMQIRPINTQLYSAGEKERLQDTVAVMLSTGLEYIQEKAGEVQLRFVLSPPVDTIIQFKIFDNNRKDLSHSTKQLITTEISKEKIRRSDASFKNAKAITRIDAPVQVKQIKESSISASKFVTKKRSFTFQVVKKAEKTEKNENILSKIINEKMFYKFNEGCTNAVKRSVKFSEL